MTTPYRYRGVRYREDTGFEMRCDSCPAYWPLTTEFWNVKHGMSRCAACWLVYWRRRQAHLRSADPELRRAYDRARYRRNRKLVKAKRRAFYAANREAICAASRARYAAKVAA